MNLKKSMANSMTVKKLQLKAYKAAPTVAFVAGAVGSVASLYLMWRAARKHEEVVSDAEDIIAEVHEKKPVEITNEDGTKQYVNDEDTLPINQYRVQLVKAYCRAGFKVAKLYAPVAVAEAVSVGLMGLGYGKLSTRYANTLAAASLIERQYAKYRQNVIDKYGEDADREFRFGLKKKEIEVPDLDENGNPKLNKNGDPKTKKVTEYVLGQDLDFYSQYARIFDKENSNRFDGDEDAATSYYNRSFLIQAQEYFNMLLKYRGYVFLSEVYAYLGYKETKASRKVGWWYDLEHPTGDNKIQFVPIEFYDEKYYAKSVILDFNVDGQIDEYLPEI